MLQKTAHELTVSGYLAGYMHKQAESKEETSVQDAAFKRAEPNLPFYGYSSGDAKDARDYFNKQKLGKHVRVRAATKRPEYVPTEDVGRLHDINTAKHAANPIPKGMSNADLKRARDANPGTTRPIVDLYTGQSVKGLAVPDSEVYTKLGSLLRSLGLKRK